MRRPSLAEAKRGVLRLGAGLLLGAAALSSACGPVVSAPAPGRRGSDIVTRAELAAQSESNLLRALERMRPSWFGGRAVRSVWLDPLQWLGGPRALADFSTSDVEAARRISESETAILYGTEHPGPSVVLLLRRPGT